MRIALCEITFVRYQCLVHVILEDGSYHDSIITYFPDELSFSASQFIGKTIDEACEYKRRRDVAYLRS